MNGRSASRLPRGYVMTPEEAPRFWQLGNLWRVVASGHLTGGSFSLIDQLVTDDGGGPSTHLHPSDEGLYVVSGHCTFHAAGQALSAGAGSLVVVPRFTEHSFVVDAPGTQLLNFYLPSGFETFLMGFSHPATRNELPKKGEVPLPPPELVLQLSRDYDQLAVPGIPMATTKRPEPHEFITRANPDAVVPPFLSAAESSARYWHGGERWSVLADGPRTEGSFCLFDVCGYRGAGVPPSVSVSADSFLYVLEGTVDVLLGDHVRTAGKGDFVFLPRGVPHARRTTSERARLLCLRTPAGFERVLGLLGERTDSLAPPPPDWTGPKVDGERAQRVFDDLGLRRVAVSDPLKAQPTKRGAGPGAALDVAATTC